MLRYLQLAKRFERREEAKAEGEEAKETGNLRARCSPNPLLIMCAMQVPQKTSNVSRDGQSK